jgi:dynein heavy chain, axonemal
MYFSSFTILILFFSLEEQLLGEVVKAERPDLESLRAGLTKQQNDFKITLKTLEDDLLKRLSSAGPDILSDSALVINLETTKKTAADIEIKVEEGKITAVKIDEARERYRCDQFFTKRGQYFNTLEKIIDYF